MKKSKVNIVFCMDTEGPCNDPGNNELLKDWALVNSAMDKLFNKDFRFCYPDSIGKNFKIGWFFLSWTGFKTNPRGRDFGYHKVRDHYLNRWGEKIKDYGDEECWHYHHPPLSGVGNEWSREWKSSKEYKNIISRQILDREWFPSSFRAGGTIMGPELSKWVDKWFPFDYSNRAPIKYSEMDWSDGVVDWKPYKPNPEKFKSRGDGKRYMTRCMDLKTGIYEISKEEINKAFIQASENGSSILSVFDHDYRDIENRIKYFLKDIEIVSKDFKDINWEYASPSQAIINHFKLNIKKVFSIVISFEKSKLRIKTSSKIHQPFPWVAIKYKDHNYEHLDNGFQDFMNNTWEIDIDNIDNIDSIGVAASDTLGNSDVKIITFS